MKNKSTVSIKKQIPAFENWLRQRGCEILPLTNEYELIRWKGRGIGVLYITGKTNGNYAVKAINCFKRNKKWDGAPINTGRKNTYKREKKILITRDGTNCFYCGLEMENDISLEHLIDLKKGGPNTLENMVLAHGQCNKDVDRFSLVEKIKYAMVKLSMNNIIFKTQDI